VLAGTMVSAERDGYSRQRLHTSVLEAAIHQYHAIPWEPSQGSSTHVALSTCSTGTGSTATTARETTTSTETTATVTKYYWDARSRRSLWAINAVKAVRG
jgi:YD repeat-containing protein